MLRWIAVLGLALAILLAAGLWYGEQRYKDCLYENIASVQADNTGGSPSAGLEQVGRIDCSRSPF